MRVTQSKQHNNNKNTHPKTTSLSCAPVLLLVGTFCTVWMKLITRITEPKNLRCSADILQARACRRDSTAGCNLIIISALWWEWQKNQVPQTLTSLKPFYKSEWMLHYHTHTHTCACMYTQTHARAHTTIHKDAHTCSHAHIYAHSHTHTWVVTCIHTPTNTHTT